MSNESNLQGVVKAEVVKRIVARCIADKVWLEKCVDECAAYASKKERPAVKAYAKAEYDAAGAGHLGRWTTEQRFGRGEDK